MRWPWPFGKTETDEEEQENEPRMNGDAYVSPGERRLDKALAVSDTRIKQAEAAQHRAYLITGNILEDVVTGTTGQQRPTRTKGGG